MKSKVLCAKCKHEIVKRNGVWKHSYGGTYCKAKWTGNIPHLGGCLCNDAKPIGEIL